MLKGIEFARVHDWPFLATCGGFQYALIEFARNVLGIPDATTAEKDSESQKHRHLSRSLRRSQPQRRRPETLRKSPRSASVPAPTCIVLWQGKEVVTEEFFCNFEVNPEYEWMTMEAGFPVVARGSKDEIRAIESPTHRFFIATLFQPQLSSTEKNPHPVVLAFVQAAADWGRKKLDDSVLE